MMPDSDLHAHVAGAIEQRGYCIVHGFMGASAVAALAAECRALDAQSKLLPAAVGRGGSRRREPAIRGDRTLWFERHAPTPAQARYWERLDALRLALNRALLLGLDELEAHYAVYPPGKSYARHRDRFRDDDARVVSSVLYLNTEWNDADGGALRIHLPAGGPAEHVDVPPLGGTLALFLSAEFEHEVLPATRERVSIAGWFRRAATQWGRLQPT
jgi:SM-20-related protein